MADVNRYSAVNVMRQARHAIKEPQSYLQLTVSMTRSIWKAGTPIDIAIQTSNRSERRLLNITVGLIRRLNAFSAIGQDDSSALVPTASTYRTVACASAKDLGSWQPVDTGVMDAVSLAVQAPVSGRYLYKMIRVCLLIYRITG